MPEVPYRAWPDAADYRYLEHASRHQFAWEWLRRDQDYRNFAPSARHSTAKGLTIVEPAPDIVLRRWGCLFVEGAHVSVPDFPMLWHPDLDISALRVVALPAEAGEGIDLFDFARWATKAVLVKGEGGEYCLLREGHHHIHLHVIAGTLMNGPVMLRFDIGWCGRFEPVISTLRRFLHLCRSGEMLAERPIPDRMRHRAILMLRVHDAWVQGASIRDVAIMLFGQKRIEAEWRDPGESLKSQCRRLIASARAMTDGGYKVLLR